MLTFLTKGLEESSVLMEGNHTLVTIAIAHKNDSLRCHGDIGGFAEMRLIRTGYEAVSQNQRRMVFVSFVEFEDLRRKKNEFPQIIVNDSIQKGRGSPRSNERRSGYCSFLRKGETGPVEEGGMRADGKSLAVCPIRLHVEMFSRFVRPSEQCPYPNAWDDGRSALRTGIFHRISSRPALMLTGVAEEPSTHEPKYSL